jgi:magnesium-transporting ATPase (P-type)
VAIPEGLPLSVSISLAYSVGRMQKDNNLVRVLAACEIMGGATNICSDKTGTLTENLMTVTQGFFAGRPWSQLPTRADFASAYLDILVDSIASNSRAELGKDLPNGRTEIIGNKTEGAMLIFLRTLGVDYVAQRGRLDIARTFPFSSAKKRMSTLVRTSGNEGILYIKGASEIITELCQSYLANDGSTQVCMQCFLIVSSWTSLLYHG